MKFGLGINHILGPSPGVQDVIGLAQEAEAIGYHSIVVADHVLVPRSVDDSTYPAGTFQADVPWYDPFVVLAALAGATSTIRLGTGIAVVPYRPPVLQAQAVATLDFISGGRFRYGAGIGWMREEFDVLGVSFSDRGRRADEYLEAMKVLWSGSGSGYHGTYVDFEGGHLHPLPTGRPHPMLLIGGESQAALRRVARYGDGFYVNWKTVPQFEHFLLELSVKLSGRDRMVSDLYMQLGASDVQLVRREKASLPDYAALGLDEIVYSPSCNSVAEGLDQMQSFAAEFF